MGINDTELGKTMIQNYRRQDNDTELGKTMIQNYHL